MGAPKLEIALKHDICIHSVDRILAGCVRDNTIPKYKTETMLRVMEDDIDETKLVRVKDERRIREVIVNGKVMYDVFDFMFGW